MRALRLAASATVLATTPALADGHAAPEMDGHVSVAAEDMLAPYYARLKQKIDLPLAPANVSLAPDTNVTHVGFGSCIHQSRHQTIWAQIAAKKPDLFLLIGDNNYGDQGWAGDATLGTLRAAYGVMAKSPELAAFRSKVPMMATWDDHDFGFNDGGANFAFRQWSETIFETFWGANTAVKSRPGIYESTMFGEKGKRLQIIMLDTRYFRSDFDRMPYQSSRPPLGSYVPSNDPAKTMLGDAQWRWLEQELAKPADMRILVSSIQVITDAHNYEVWENLPLERQKLYSMLSAREDSGLVMLTGDRHAAGIYSEKIGNETVWELTSSSLNYSFSSTEQNTAREPDDKRVTDLISEENFGAVEIDWKKDVFTMKLFGNQGEERASKTVKW